MVRFMVRQHGPFHADAAPVGARDDGFRAHGAVVVGGVADEDGCHAARAVLESPLAGRLMKECVAAGEAGAAAEGAVDVLEKAVVGDVVCEAAEGAWTILIAICSNL